MARDTIIVGNWKMHKTIEEAVDYVQQIETIAANCSRKICLSVPFTAISPLTSLSSSVIIGAQNLHDAEEGAFTGEISAKMVKEVGAQFVLLGHSERRHIFGETDDFINRKVHRAISEGIDPIVCVGETLEEREAGKTDQVLSQQIQKSLKDITNQQMKRVVLAYEPVWAIGTGKTATSEIAEEAHHFCRQFISQQWDQQVSESLSILYGGSVKPSNAEELISLPNIDGVLVGGASLSVESFAGIIQAKTRI